MPKKKGDTKKLAPVDKEVIIQTQVATKNKAETARRTGFSYGTVCNILKAADEDGLDMRVARAEAIGKMASKNLIKAEEILDSIGAEDIQSGRFAIRDKDGDIIGYKYYGPSLLQKMTAYGIITDKGAVLAQNERALVQDENTGVLLLPQNIEGLVGAIQHQIKELSILNVRFEQDNPDLVTKANEVIAEVEDYKESDHPEVINFDEFADK